MRGFTCATRREPRQSRRSCELAFAANCPAGQAWTRDPVVGSARRRASSARSVWSAPARAGALAEAQRPAHAQLRCGAKGKRRLRFAPSPHSKRWRVFRGPFAVGGQNRSDAARAVICLPNPSAIALGSSGLALDAGAIARAVRTVVSFQHFRQLAPAGGETELLRGGQPHHLQIRLRHPEPVGRVARVSLTRQAALLPSGPSQKSDHRWLSSPPGAWARLGRGKRPVWDESTESLGGNIAPP